MEKLFIDKSEGVAEIVEKIIGSEEDSVTLVVPKNAALGGSVSNFHLIKREAESAGKTVTIESVDESVLALAQSSDLEAVHPLLDRKGSALSDIVPLSIAGDKKNRPEQLSRKSKKEPNRRAEEKPVSYNFKPSITEGEEEEEEVILEARVGRKERAQESKAREWMSLPRLRLPKLGGKRALLVIGVVVLVIAGFFVTGRFLNRATIQINFRRTPWSYEHQFTADSAVAKINADNNILPAEFFTPQTNMVQPFPASGSSTVSEKATGKITIYNAYSSAPQTLVATTRFATPDGKIFRIINQVIVPGAVIKNGQITPSSIDANIIADKAGVSYNVGPIAKLTIPGFQGTPRYAGFYGGIKIPTSGGFVGFSAVPTAGDISKSKARVSDLLTTRLNSSFLSSYPADFKILEGASSITITKLSADAIANASGTFNVFGEANMKTVGFKESDLKSVLTALAQKDNPGMVFDSLDLTYGKVQVDLIKGSESFDLTAKGTLKPDFSADDFVAQILGKSVDDAQKLITGLPHLVNAKISLWPVWLKNMPSAANKIKVLVN
ncbi:MAG: hypothetical protein KGJ89_00230 [Patescibacteria group bacterium]|nr:hypothetical protein [Patescibacteria group bacterium]MDE2014948.1 hypothetical protein [Patescibacteria group bacterium]MDE2226377.1 hypothetical protein [Patescibacteria group bacterium]